MSPIDALKAKMVIGSFYLEKSMPGKKQLTLKGALLNPGSSPKRQLDLDLFVLQTSFNFTERLIERIHATISFHLKKIDS